MVQQRARTRDDSTRLLLADALSWALCIAVCGSSAGCKEASAAELIKDKATLAERSKQGTAHWNVESDGETRLVLTDEKGKVLKEGVTGQLTFKVEGDAKPKVVNLEQEPKTGVLHADGPDLDAPVTEMRYALLVGGKTRTGALHVPGSGTKGLRESADAAEKAGQAKGPHGGTIQIAGKKRYEVAADSASGEVRVYLLDADVEKPKRVKLALDADHPSVVELKWHASGYYVARVDAHYAPRKATLVVVDDDDTHVVVVGYRPGIILVLDARPTFWVHRDWDHPGLARGHYKGTVYGPPGHYRDHDDDHARDRGHDKVMVKSNKGGQKVHIKVH